MKSILALVLGLCLLPVVAIAREPQVTQAEAAAVFAKAEQIMKGVLQYKGKHAAFPSGAGVASREQIIRHFSALYNVLQPKFKFTPPRLKSAAGVMNVKDAQTKQTALRLEVLGFVDRYGPLVTSKTDGLIPREFGDALGYFMARVAELTHTPSTKFSPYLTP